MNTKTMYETIMDLPLFKGVGEDHISSFLEKTSIEFHKFPQGEIIAEKGEPVKSLKFILSGKIRLLSDALNGKAEISSVLDNHEAVGATRLFGLHPHYDVTVEALENVAVMEFSKEKYVRLLQSDPIYMMNFANLLSMNVQKTIETFPFFMRLDLSRIFAEWIVLFTGRKSTDIRIKSPDSLAEVYGKDFVKANLDKLENLALIKIEGNEILILDREAFLEYAVSSTDARHDFGNGA